MKIKDLFSRGRPVFSLEVFPPKRTSPVETIYSTLDTLKDLNPGYISVTYGAGGNTADSSTSDIAKAVKNDYQIEPLAHLTCVNCSKEDILTVLDRLEASGVENIMALRGDNIGGVPPKDDFRYASELTDFIISRGGFSVSGACYPEGHMEAKSLEEDIENLKIKVNAGVSHLVSQLFFDNAFFYNFLDMARTKGINVPVQAGIMPVVNKKQIERMVTLCGASLPAKFTKMMQRYENSPEALKDAGIAYAVDQIVDLISQGAQGIHLYTMNNPYIAEKIANSIQSLLIA